VRLVARYVFSCINDYCPIVSGRRTGGQFREKVSFSSYWKHSQFGDNYNFIEYRVLWSNADVKLVFISGY